LPVSILRHIAVDVSYYTDPCCPLSWALARALRKLIWEFGESLSMTYVMCAMAQKFGDPESQIGEALAAAASGGMPVDIRSWLESPVRSSHPACIAVKAAADQGGPWPYLRRLRDLDRARAVPASEWAEGSERVKLPSLEFRRPDGVAHGVYGFSSFEELPSAALAAGAAVGRDERPGVEEALRWFGSMATSEVAAVCELPGPRAPAEPWRLASEWRARAERVGSVELWTVA
jgi:hypothetical protein